MRFTRRFELASPGRDDAQRWERMVRNILLRSAAELERRQQRVDVLENLVSWTRPALATAAGLVGLSLLAIWQIDSAGAETFPTLFRASTLPAEMVVWIEESEPPLRFELFTSASERE